jgi:hypothetical protein
MSGKQDKKKPSKKAKLAAEEQEQRKAPATPINDLRGK